MLYSSCPVNYVMIRKTWVVWLAMSSCLMHNETPMKKYSSVSLRFATELSKIGGGPIVICYVLNKEHKLKGTDLYTDFYSNWRQVAQFNPFIQSKRPCSAIWFFHFTYCIYYLMLLFAIIHWFSSRALKMQCVMLYEYMWRHCWIYCKITSTSSIDNHKNKHRTANYIRQKKK